ncbi:HNH endonuclease [Mycolicibacterium llatzerense]|uniref:HNH endonuclease n=1 Tax=Mycolicibacterium llatzerense TaxID=280871 RepID=A0A0D1JNE3_9MYCO|nr:DUF222 domain-containing protein [Mycolicibacterium llatzerense]KIU14099.1 HNH endonuclease [Mycolicibacterium llatzerense]MCT7369275.1 HNH endonuclease [Mycolicibacterium llatzerense]
MFEVLAAIDPDAGEAALRDQLVELERLKGLVAAQQVRVTAAWDAVRQAGGGASRRGLGTEIGLARRQSPHQGKQYLATARMLSTDMPHTLAALESGALPEWRAGLICREAACLSTADRAELDAQMCADPRELEGLGDKKITARAKRIAYRLDHEAVLDKIRQALSGRRVTVRPAPDAMAYLTVLLPVVEAYETHGALKAAAGEAARDGSADGRTRSQIMADTVVERVTGRAAASPTPVAVNLVLSDETLLAGGSEPAELPGYGPIPAPLARQLIERAVLDEQSEASLRRLYAQPATGNLVAMESKSRTFPKGLARFIATRDQTCRTPYCNAPVRHLDHITPHAHHGPTAGHNGQGLCEHCNYVKEEPGWHSRASYDRYGRHTTELTTPTGAVYTSTAPPMPSGLQILTRRVHLAIIDKGSRPRVLRD